MSVMENESPVEGQEGLLPPTTTTPPGWGPPRSPLPPHRLAALANALGVSTPSPATRPTMSFMSSSNYPGTAASASYPERDWRSSPTPSSTSTHGFSSYQPSTSKFLLHVTPPLHLPHESNSTSDNASLTPPPSSASGYHTQFRRGTLVPLHPTLQSQMVAIAKEYALPSTAGMIVYLVSASTPRSSPTPGSESGLDEDHEPGPRLSEDIWKHLWTRVLKAEREETLATRSPTPNYGLGLGIGMKSSPYLTQEPSGQIQPLRPLFSPSLRGATPQQNYPMTPSPSTPSSTSDLRSHSHAKSVAPSFSSRSQSQSEPDTPDTSSGSHADEQEPDPRAEGLHLPGLHSPSLIPILAKVEFDIDRRKAGWYEPWIRSRRMNHLKRSGNRKALTESDEKTAPIQLRLAQGITDGGYTPLSDSPEPTDPEAVDTETADPLEEVFGNDADTWADIHGDAESLGIIQPQNPEVVELALTGGELAEQSAFEEIGDMTRDEDEVMDLLDKMDRPQLSVSIPPSPSGGKRKSSPTTAGTIKKHVPPPLTLPLAPDGSPLPTGSGDSTHLAYLTDTATLADEPLSPEDSDDVKYRSPLDEKRDGGVFDDLDLGLGDFSFDENDPHDRRKSQFIMKAQLDEIERTLAQFSPKRLDKDDHLDDDVSEQGLKSGSLNTQRAPSPSSPLKNEDTSMDAWPDRSVSLKGKPKHHTVRYENAQGKAKLNEEEVPAAPGWTEDSLTVSKKKQNRNTFKLEGNTAYEFEETETSWPAVPTFIPQSGTAGSSQPSKVPPSPPRLALNGIQTSTPRASIARKTSDPKEAASKESQIWQRAVGGDKRSQTSPPGRKDSSPVIPLSPDPFGRFSSNESNRNFGSGPPNPRHEAMRSNASATTSRFSADSMNGEEIAAVPIKAEKGTSLVGVRSVRNLWRKSKKPSISSQPIAGQGRSSPNPPPLPGSSQEQLNMPPKSPGLPPKSPGFPPAQFPPSQPPPRPKHARVDSALDHFHFDQESPYPTRKSPTNKISPRPSISERPPSPPPPAAPDRSSIRKSILKGWKGIGSTSQPQGATLEPRPSNERRPSGEGSWSNSNETVKQRRPSVLDVADSMRASATSTPDIPPPSPRVPTQYLQNGRVPGLSERRKSKPKMLSSSSADSLQMSPPPARSPLLGPGTSPPRSMISVASSRESEDTRPSFDAGQFEMVSPKVNNSLSYPYHALDHDDQ